MKTTFPKTFTRKEKILSVILVLTILISFFPVSNLFAWTAPENTIIYKGGPTPLFYNKWGTPLVSGFYVTSTGELAYCADQSATGPGGTPYTLNDAALRSDYFAAIQAAIQNGYPFNKGTLTEDEARYATQIVIHWLESYYLGGGNGYDYLIRGETTTIPDHQDALQFALDLFNVSVSGVVATPKVTLETPTPWTNVGGVLQCTVPVTQVNTQGWNLITVPTGVAPANGTSFSGNTSIVLQLTDPAAYAASDKKIAIQGYCNYDTANIHVFTAGGGYQTMVAVSTAVAYRDPTSVTLNDASGELRIHKVTQLHSGAQSPEAGAVFQVYSVSPAALVAVLTTDANGDASVSNLPLGTYNVHQAVAPSGTIPAADQLITLSGDPITYGNFVNDTTYFPITKTDTDTGVLVQGAEITVYQGASVIATRTTGADGKAWFEGVPAGSYTWRETAAPAGYELNLNTFSFTLNADGTIAAGSLTDFSDEKGNGKIEIQKTTDRSGLAVLEPGAVFEIYLTSAGSYASSPADSRDRITTGANGYAVSKTLPYGNYSVRQVSAPMGTIMNASVWTVDVGTDGTGTVITGDMDTVNAVNASTYGKFEISKTTNRGYSIPESGAAFEVFSNTYASYAAAPVNERDTITTSAGGTAITKDLPYGVYRVHQSSVPEGTLAVADFTVTIGETDGTIVHRDVSNETYWGEIEIHKYRVSPSDPSETQIPEPGASFRIYPSEYASWEDALAALPAEQQAVLTDEITSDISGVARTAHRLPFGTYTVEQIDNAATADTFKVAPWQVTIGAVQNEVYTYTRENPIYEQFLRIIKTDADMGAAIPLAGAAFEILDASNNVLTDRYGKSVFYTDSTGAVDLSSLPLQPGTYGIRETKAPTGYAPSPDVLHFTVDKTDHGTSLVTVESGKDIRTVSIGNRKISGILEIHKLAADTQLPMPGVVFEVYDKDGILMDTMTTDLKGQATTRILPYGDYTLIETATLTGYILADKTAFSIYLAPKPGEMYSTTELTLSNQRMGVIEVYKVTADGASTPMNGVVFGVYDAKTDKEITRITTDKNGYGYVYVNAGDYFLKEFSTWEGYSILTDKIMVKDVNYAQVCTLRLTNSLSELKVCKESTSGVPLAGMEFVITTDSGQPVPVVYDETRDAYIAAVRHGQTKGEEAAVPTTGENGEVLILGLPNGTYVISETRAPDGYSMDASPKTAVITESASGKAAAVVTLVDSPVTAKTGETDGRTWIMAATGVACLTASAILVVIRVCRKRSSSIPSDSPED